MKVDEKDAVRLVAQTWRRTMAPQLAPSCCILAARLVTGALTALGVRSADHPVAVAVYNKVGWAERHLPMDEWSPEAWSVGASSRTVQYQFRQIGGFDGHVIVATDNFLLDLSVSQFDRPMRNIVSGGPLVAPFSSFEDMGPNKKIGLLEGTYLIGPEPWNMEYRETLDWERGWKKLGGEFMDNLKESFCGQAQSDQGRDAYAEGGVSASYP